MQPIDPREMEAAAKLSAACEHESNPHGVCVFCGALKPDSGDQWEPPMRRPRHAPPIYLGAAHQLWDLLDDIDSLSDSMHPDKTPFYEAVMRLVERRHQILKSDGYSLSLSEQKH